MRRRVPAVAILGFALAADLASAEATAPTFCAEWIVQSREGYERLTLFADRNVVWKSSRGGTDQLKRQRLTPEETSFYCDYFRSGAVWSGAEDLRSGLTGEFVRQSVVTLAGPTGRKQIRFDEFSALTPEVAALRSSLEGLKGTFTAPLAPTTRFAPDRIPPGTILRRFDGVLFRVRKVEAQKGVVELEGVREPYSEFRKIEELRFLFVPPDRP